MPQRVFVKRVTVEYAVGNKRFSVEFMDVPRALVFNTPDLARFNIGLGAIPTFRFNPTQPLQEQQLAQNVGATSQLLAGEDITATGEDLWWLTDTGWFHPQD